MSLEHYITQVNPKGNVHSSLNHLPSPAHHLHIESTMKPSNCLLYSSVLALSALSSAAPTSPVQWSQCPERFVHGVQCAQMKVPLNWDNPNGNKITIGLTRLPATKPKSASGTCSTILEDLGVAPRRTQLPGSWRGSLWQSSRGTIKHHWCGSSRRRPE